MPTTAITTFSASNRLDPLFDFEELDILNVSLAPSTTYAKGTVLGEITATPGTYKAYASGNVDGSQNPAGLLQYGVTTDASGAAVLIGEQGATQKFFPMIMPCGAYFKCADLVGLDANAVTKLAAVIVEGTVSAGIVKI